MFRSYLVHRTEQGEEHPMATTEPAVRAHGLVKTYGDVPALDGLDLEVPAGTVCGLLGPNGAGKTTAVRIFSTLLHADGGSAEVAGIDVAAQAHEVRRRIGLTGQDAAVDEILTGHQNLTMFGRLHHLGAKRAKARAAELLEQFHLTDARDKQLKAYSGGMRRRLDLAAGPILAPPVLFLDEPTTGLDPRNRNEVWDAIRVLVAGGTTVLLTTQYLEEADHLADQIVVIDAGRAIADGTPVELKQLVGGDQIDVVVAHRHQLPTVAALVQRVVGAEAQVDEDERRVSAPVPHRVTALTEVVKALDQEQLDPEDIALRRPTLDEVFLHLTGRKAEAGEHEPEPTHKPEEVAA
jgi:ABC-2 type transport system ATP-binding protein